MAEPTGLRALLPWVGVVAMMLGVASSAGVALFKIDAQAGEIEKLEHELEETEDIIEEIQRLLIQRQGEVKLDVQRIENTTRSLRIQQEKQGEDLEEILRLLRQRQ